MQIVDEYSHRFGEIALEEKGLLESVRSFCSNSVRIEKGAGPIINEHFRIMFESNGWAMDARVHPGYNLDVNALKDGVALTVQTGNITRAFYDLLKFQAMHMSGRAEAAVLIVASSQAANRIGSNVANFDRVSSELHLFGRTLFVPTLLISFE